MVTQTAIAKHWGVTISRVNHCVKHQGCPTDSFEAADKWREDRGKKREPTNGKIPQIGEKPATEIQPEERPSNTGDSLTDALNNAICVADGAFDDYQFARVNKMASRSIRLSEFNKALETRLKAEKAFREEKERRSLVIPKFEATEMIRRCMESMLRRLKKLPGEKGPQCNPQDPLRAVGILESEVNAIIADGKDSLDALESAF